MAQLPQHHVIENVLQSKMRGKVTYQGNLLASTTLQLTYVKPYDHPSGKGYQRPVDNKRCNEGRKKNARFVTAWYFLVVIPGKRLIGIQQLFKGIIR